ncbi:hypothetical protein AAFH68_16340 [Flavobacterium sp. CGRL1]
MIFIGNIGNSILEAHWTYFTASDGYSKLVALADDVNLEFNERRYFARLKNDENLLKSIIIGRPDQLKTEIEYYQANVVTSVDLLLQYQMFLSFGTYEQIHEQINKKAEVLFGKDAVTARKRDYCDKFTALKDLLSPGLFVSPDPETKISIDLIKKIYSKLKTQFNEDVKNFYARIYSVFNYDALIESKEPWGAYKLTNALEVTVCPYCNRNYIHTSYNEHGKTRPELDHFFPKSKYPFLSISLYNLIPSCHICNSNLKGAKDFYLEPHLHPFIENKTSDFQFEVKYRDEVIDDIVADLESFDIVLTTLTEDDQRKLSIENSCKTFLINELYNLHKDVAQELLFKSVYYNETKIDELKNMLGDHAGIDDNFIKRVIIGTYADSSSIGKRSLSKYSFDIISKTDLKRTLDL